VSDTERHGPARDERTFRDLCEACQALLVDVVAGSLVRKWGADALTPLISSDGTDKEHEILRPLLADLIRRNAIPTVSWQDALQIMLRNNKRARELLLRNSRRRSHSPKRYRFIIPTPTWDGESINTSLVVLAPARERVLDPRVDSRIIALLINKNTDGWGESFVTFDENDVFARVKGEGNDFFSAINGLEIELADTHVASAYLDVLKSTRDSGGLSADDEDALQETLMLPDTTKKAVAFKELYLGAQLPSGIPGLHLPPILHPQIASHAFLKGKRWRPDKFTLDSFLLSNALQETDEKTRRRFWNWLRKNPNVIPAGGRAKLADIPIWPDIAGELCKLSALCSPRSTAVVTALGSKIRRPHKEILRSGLVDLDKKRRLSIRRTPTFAELRAWYRERTSKFSIGEMADSTTMIALERFEADLVSLFKVP